MQPLIFHDSVLWNVCHSYSRVSSALLLWDTLNISFENCLGLSLAYIFLTTEFIFPLQSIYEVLQLKCQGLERTTEQSTIFEEPLILSLFSFLVTSKDSFQIQEKHLKMLLPFYQIGYKKGDNIFYNKETIKAGSNTYWLQYKLGNPFKFV